jgi:hypothetical protein
VVDDMIVRPASDIRTSRTRRRGVERRVPVARGNDASPGIRSARGWWRGVLLTLAALVIVAPAARAQEAQYRTEVLPHTVAAHAASARTPHARTQLTLRTRASFSLVALRWTSQRVRVTGALRAQHADGSWTAWMTLETQTGSDGVARGADGAEAVAGARRSAAANLRGATEPVWTGPARRLQIRLRGAAPHGLRAAFARVTAAGRRVAAQAARARRDDSLAGIQPRAAWDPDNTCAPRETPSIGAVQAVAVHHTVGSNDYTQAQVPAVILGICAFHRNGNGWNDIGYNILVDRFGGAWEGRAGGITQAIVGAQAQGFNAVTAGIAMLGDFQVDAPTAAQLATVERIAAWRLAVAGVPRSGTVDLTSAGGSLSRYKADAVATVPRVVGHRDVGLTECPGGAAYALLDEVRGAVAAANPVVPVVLPAPITPTPVPRPVRITIATQRQVDAGLDSVVRGTATQGGAPLTSAAVALQVASASDWKTVAQSRTTPAGRYAFAHRFSRSWKLRVVRTDGDGGTSSTVAMNLVPRLRLSVPKRLTVDRRVVLRGSISPGRGPVQLTIERRTASGRYVAGSAVATTLTGRRVSVAITPHAATLYRFRLTIAASELSAAGRSPLMYSRASTAQTSGGASVAAK